MTTETVPVPDTKPPLPPTPRQLEILAFIESRQRLTGPTIPNGVTCHLVALERKGYLKRRHTARGIEVLK